MNTLARPISRIVFAGLVTGALTFTEGTAAAQTTAQPGKLVQKWEYATLTARVYAHLSDSKKDSVSISWTTGRGVERAEKEGARSIPWKDLYKALGGKDSKESFEILVFDLLGQDGWELVSHSTVIDASEGRSAIRPGDTFVSYAHWTKETWTFKRPRQ